MNEYADMKSAQHIIDHLTDYWGDSEGQEFKLLENYKLICTLNTIAEEVKRQEYLIEHIKKLLKNKENLEFLNHNLLSRVKGETRKLYSLQRLLRSTWLKYVAANFKYSSSEDCVTMDTIMEDDESQPNDKSF